MCAKICELKYLRCVRQLPQCLFWIVYVDHLAVCSFNTCDSFVVHSIVHFKWYGFFFSHITHFFPSFGWTFCVSSHLWFSDQVAEPKLASVRVICLQDFRMRIMKNKKTHTHTHKHITHTVRRQIRVMRLRTEKMNKIKHPI